MNQTVATAERSRAAGECLSVAGSAGQRWAFPAAVVRQRAALVLMMARWARDGYGYFERGAVRSTCEAALEIVEAGLGKVAAAAELLDTRAGDGPGASLARVHATAAAAAAVQQTEHVRDQLHERLRGNPPAAVSMALLVANRALNLHAPQIRRELRALARAVVALAPAPDRARMRMEYTGQLIEAMRGTVLRGGG